MASTQVIGTIFRSATLEVKWSLIRRSKEEVGGKNRIIFGRFLSIFVKNLKVGNI